MMETSLAPDPSDIVEPPTDQEAAAAEASPYGAKRVTKFMAELSRAMQAAVETARTETMARFEAEAKGVVDAIHEGATAEAATIRSNADGDIAAVRDWSKTEIARIREETEARIAARKTALDSELVEHAATIEARTERVSAVVAAFEAELAAFFERLNAEEDPTRIATMAENMPEPPSLEDVAASVSGVPGASEPSEERFARFVAPAEAANASNGVDFAAAEAEAASYVEHLDSADGLTPTEAEDLDAAPAEDAAPLMDEAPSQLATTRVVVSGLVSVANIANFKRSLGHLPGVASIAVASGRDGDFAFTVGHTLGSALVASVRTLPGFDIEITNETEGAIIVSATDRDSDG